MLPRPRPSAPALAKAGPGITPQSARRAAPSQLTAQPAALNSRGQCQAASAWPMFAATVNRCRAGCEASAGGDSVADTCCVQQRGWTCACEQSKSGTYLWQRLRIKGFLWQFGRHDRRSVELCNIAEQAFGKLVSQHMSAYTVHASLQGCHFLT